MPSRFSPEDVHRLASLARLDLSEQEVALFAEQLSEILAFAAEVQGVQTGSIDLAGHAGSPRVLREDDAEPSLRREDVLAAAPAADRVAGLFTVPRVFRE